ncbi:TonB-dependent receptor plug domain-containing protein [Croceitalea sp. MTPC5]|uniref:TonB-dependent receptor plug domain-containing protein n=1 Tax=Croceitalea sp. MTPC5 TaxID=3056565 RepID=UPI002B3965F0|nr:TonB-dependent receptor plug domain-containing protein [Croceitalea sp. MTPC5]
MKTNFWLLVIFLISSFSIKAQNEVTGLVMEANSENPLNGANVYWLNSPIGTITKKNGVFSIPFESKYNKLVISYIGFTTDTLTITEPTEIKHWLKPENQLDEVIVEQKREAVQKTFFAAQNVVTVNSAELLKAACCNLSESFETNPAIDVNFNDALTGTKQIQMLGLTSPYLLITQENIPMVRGASQTYGLTFTPGTWVESIQITKGAGSVVNGYESISGQINTELVKPLTDNPLFINAYGNRNGRLELNAHINQRLSDKWSTGLYLHGNDRSFEIDNNDDGFLDAPLATQINIQNRWQYQNPEKGWVSFFNVRFLNDEKQVGQTDFDPDTDRFTTNVWGSEIDTKRFDSSLKLGYVFPELPYQSFGFQASYSKHQQDSFYGFNVYDINHTSIYSNLIFNSILGNTQNKFKTGITVAYDAYEELVNDQDFERVDRSIGTFFEYSYDDLDKVSLTAGLRFDTHNRLGNFFTPRLHIRYTPWERGSLRGSFGIGRRAANIFAENQRLFASSRTIQLIGNGGEVYGFDGEKALNFGFSFIQGFTLFERSGNVSLDFYRTDFENQVVVDWENPRAVRFSNLEGQSYANSLQIELNYEVLPQLELRTAYKFYDVKTDYQTGLLQQPLQARNRYFLNLGYNTVQKENGSQWRFDYTLHTLGEQRLPSTEVNPVEFQLGDFVQGYSLMNTQITRVFSKKFEVYLGGENLTNFRQDNPVLAANDPFGPNFDTTIVYAPVLGTMVYAGFRFKS